MRLLIVAGIAFLAAIILIGITSSVHPNWTYQAPGDQCEIAKNNPDGTTPTVLEPFDTWSNLAYLFAGVLILVSTQRLLGYTLGAYLCVLAITSGAYHASLQETTQFMDVAGIYLVLFAAGFYAIERAIFNLRGTQIPQKFQGLFMLLPLVGIPIAAFRGPVCLFDSTTVFIIFAVVLFGLILRQLPVVDITFAVIILLLISGSSFFFRLADGRNIRGSYTLTAAATRGQYISSANTGDAARPGDQVVINGFTNAANNGTFSVASASGSALTVANPDSATETHAGTALVSDPKILCRPDSAFQSHALWHILSAVALLLLYDLFAWIGADIRILSDAPPTRRQSNGYPRFLMSSWALSAGIFFLLDAIFKLQIVFINHNPGRDCMLTGIIVAALFLILAPLIFFKVVEP